jgi:hypothetical protein
MVSDLDTFVEAAGALRNMLDLTERRRNDFIWAANARAAQLETAARQTAQKEPPK